MTGWGVLFDMDGTLLDTEHVWLDAVHGTLRAGGVSPTPVQLAGLEGLDMEVAVARMIAFGLEAPPAAVVDELERRMHAAYDAGVAWCDGAEPLLDRLHQEGVPIGLVTSSPRRWVDRLAPVLGLHRFAIVVTADDVARRKPDPLPYTTAAAAIGLSAAACVAVEDSLVGGTAADAADCAVLLVRRADDEPLPFLPRRRVDSLADIEAHDLAAILAGVVATPV